MVGWAELKSLFQAINFEKFGEVEDEIFIEVMKVLDSDGDGSITFEEFVRMLISK